MKKLTVSVSFHTWYLIVMLLYTENFSILGFLCASRNAQREKCSSSEGRNWGQRELPLNRAAAIRL